MLWQCLAVFVALAAGDEAPTAVAQFRAPERIVADGKPIDVEVGHASPHYADFDGDGVSDLLVGQFGSGKLRIYKNHGTLRKPEFKDFTFVQAGGKDASVPSG
jgi:hypothetical protein